MIVISNSSKQLMKGLLQVIQFTRHCQRLANEMPELNANKRQ
jgi:hypothetical protein